MPQDGCEGEARQNMPSVDASHQPRLTDSSPWPPSLTSPSSLEAPNRCILIIASQPLQHSKVWRRNRGIQPLDTKKTTKTCPGSLNCPFLGFLNLSCFSISLGGMSVGAFRASASLLMLLIPWGSFKYSFKDHQYSINSEITLWLFY